MPEVQYRVAATSGGTPLLSGSAPVVSGTWSQALTIPTGVLDGATWWLGRRGVDDAGNAETWKWTSFALAAAQAGGWPGAYGTLTTRPAWTDDLWSWTGVTTNPFTAPVDQVKRTPTRRLTLPNMPAEGGDIYAAARAYFGDGVGGQGTKQAGDEVTIPGGFYTYSDNIDLFSHCNDIDIVLGSTTKALTLRSTHEDLSASQLPGVKNHAWRMRGSKRITMRAASRDYPAVLETSKVAGRTGLNQQGNTMILLDPGSEDFQAQDIIMRGARAAGQFCYTTTRAWFNRCTSEDSLADAWHITQGSSYVLLTDCESHRSGDDGVPTVYYDGGGQDAQSHHVGVVRHVVDTTGHGRGFANIGCPFFYADQIIVTGSAAAGVILDREASTGGSYHGSTNDVLWQRFRVRGCNWSEQDHGQVFVRNHINNGEVHAVFESWELRDAAPGRQRIRAIGNDSSVLDVTMRDFHFTGGRGGDEFGGNNLTRIVRTGTVDESTLGDERTPPTVVWMTPGAWATITGTLTGSTTDTSAMRNTQAVQFYAGDTGVKDASGTTVNGLASVTLHLGDTQLAALTQSNLDAAGRGAVVVDTTQFANGPARLVLRATDRLGRWRQITRDVYIQNSTPGTKTGLPSSGALGMTFGGGAVDGFAVAPTAPTSGSSGGGSTGGGGATAAPSAVTGLSGTRTSDTTARLTWAAPTGQPVTGYEVRRTIAGGSTYTLVGSPTGTTFDDTGLAGGNGYFYIVRAVNQLGSGPDAPGVGVNRL